MRVVILGPPGAGKGTQAEQIAKSNNIPHISTGEMLRAAVSSGSELGQRVSSYLDSGALVPDDLIIDIIKERITRPDCDRGFLLDGFPRTVPQAEALTGMLESLGKGLTHVLLLKVPDSVLMERIMGRASAGSGRSDDNEDVVKKRLKVYHEQTAPVAEYYKKRGELLELDGLGTIEEVRARIDKALSDPSHK
ncbi:MAG: adenylate kinase [Candidatus Dadabacteria bacterium]|nr:MAG: adenylate kinase [Candidatus Dadabacteria bacterium]